jgi:hypothetical protein
MLVTPITTTTSDGREISLTVGRAYEVLGIEADSYRMLTDEDADHGPNEPVLYEPECFQVIDASEPAFWVSELGEDGERYAYPVPWNRVGFFEDYFDRVHSVRKQFWDDLRRLYPRTWEARRGGQIASR